MKDHTQTRRWNRSALVVEDSRMERRVLGDVLAEAGYFVRYAWDLESAQRELDAEAVHVVLLDMNLPDGSGAELIATLAGTRPDIAVVVVSGEDRVGTRVRALRLGAADYLVKPYNPEELVARVDAVLAARARIRKHGCGGRDELTGVLSRATWLERFHKHTETREAGTVAIADIVGFRAFNSARGWAGGDEALMLATEALLDTFPVAATVGRTDGDEFAVLLDAIDRTEAAQHLHRAEIRFRRLIAERFGGEAGLTLATAVADWRVPTEASRVWAKAQTQLAARLRRGLLFPKRDLALVQDQLVATAPAGQEGVRYAFA